MTNKNLLKILFVEDLSSDADLEVLELKKEGLRFEHLRVDTREGFIKALNEFKPDIIISDYMMPSYNGMLALIDAREFDPSIPFILCTGSMNEETAVDCLKAGATDYVIKEHLTRLPFAVKEALEQHRIQIEKRAAELLLKENEEKLQSIFRAAPVGIGLVVDRVFFEANDTFCRMTGYTRKELIGKSAEMIYATMEEFTSVGIDKYMQIAEKGKGSVETRFKCKDGKIINILLSSTPLDKDDLTKGVTFIAMDITERVQAEEALANEKYLIYSLMSTLPDHIYFKDRHSRFIRINKSQAEFLGLDDPDQATGKTDADFFTGEHANQAYEDEQNIIRTGEPLNIEEKETHHNRPNTWVSTIKMPLRDKEGNIIGTFGISRDITERKLTEEALLKSQHLFLTLAQVSPVGIFRTDPDGNTTYVNPKWIELSGLSSEEAFGNGWLNAVHPEDREKLTEKWLENTKSKNESSAEYRFLQPDGSIIWVIGTAVPELIGNEVTGYIGTITDITERKRVENILLQSEEKYRRIFENVQDVYYETSIEGTILEVSPSIEILSKGQFHRDNLIGKSMYDFYSDINERIALLLKIKERGTVSDFEITLKNLDGLHIPCSISAKIIFDKDGHPEKILGSIHDISERKQAQDIINHERRILRTLIDNLPAPVSFKDQQGRYIFNNTAHLKSIGARKQEDTTGKTTFDFFPEAEAIEYDKDDKYVISSGEIMLGKEEISRNKETGEIYWHLTNKIPLTDEASKVTNLLTISHDITHQKLVEEELLKSQSQLMNALKLARLGSWEYDVENDIFIFNDLFYSIFRTTAEQVGGYTMKSADYANRFVHPEDKTLVGIETRKAIETDDPDFTRQLEHRIIYADGETGYIAVRICIIKNKEGKTVRTYGVNQDITETKRGEAVLIKAAEQMKLAKEKAEANDNLKTTFLNNISHEVRTPLNGILGFAEIMSQTDISEEEKRVSLTMLFESSDRLLATITNYMDISLIKSGTISLHKKDYLPEHILKELYSNIKIKCSVRNLELLLEVPEQYEKLTICSDPEILRKILTHLLNNAIKFTDKGSIKFGFTIHKTELEFFVKDTGIGIGKESLEKVFEHFVKEEHGPLKLSEGSGLGLSISKGLVELMGGKIRVESEQGIGSTLFFTVPVGKEIEYNISKPVEVKQKGNNKTISILVAEDDVVNFYYLKTLLRQHISAEIIHASNGKEAVDKFIQNPDIDLILMDIKMPVMDGLEATRQIKAINRNVPVIAITAYAMAGDESRILDAGCDHYLVKPINKKLLLDKMAEYIII